VTEATAKALILRYVEEEERRQRSRSVAAE